MIDIDNLLDQAKAGNGIKSDRQLTLKLRVGETAVTAWRRKRCLPRPDTMVSLCNLAGVDPKLWLLWLGTQASENAAKIHYEQLLNDYSRRRPGQLVA